MSWKMPNEWEQLQIDQPCEACGADPGEWCLTASGRPAQYPHASRHRLAVAARRVEMQNRRRRG